MSETPFVCSRQEECPVVLAACERKVKAETKMRITEEAFDQAEADYAKRREVMNELFAAGVAMRKAQCAYFTGRTQALLEASKAAEARFDSTIQACRGLGKPVQQTML